MERYLLLAKLSDQEDAGDDYQSKKGLPKYFHNFLNIKYVQINKP
jgi:hypothetical protein